MKQNDWVKFIYRQLGDGGKFDYNTASGYVDRVYRNGDFTVSTSNNFGNLIRVSRMAIVGTIERRAK